MMHNTGNTAASEDTAALAVDGPQPVWMTLNEARERAFTGEIVFEADPEVLAYLDNGIVLDVPELLDLCGKRGGEYFFLEVQHGRGVYTRSQFWRSEARLEHPKVGRVHRGASNGRFADRIKLPA